MPSHLHSPQRCIYHQSINLSLQYPSLACRRCICAVRCRVWESDLCPSIYPILYSGDNQQKWYSDSMPVETGILLQLKLSVIKSTRAWSGKVTLPKEEVTMWMPKSLKAHQAAIWPFCLLPNRFLSCCAPFPLKTNPQFVFWNCDPFFFVCFFAFLMFFCYWCQHSFSLVQRFGFLLSLFLDFLLISFFHAIIYFLLYNWHTLNLNSIIKDSCSVI